MTARDPARQLQRVTAAIGTEVRSRGEIANAVLTAGIDALGASAGTIGIVDYEGAALQLVAAHGYTRDIVREFGRMPLDFRAPLTDAARDGVAVVIEDPAELDARYPDVRSRRGYAAHDAVAVYPMQAGAVTFGTIGFNFPAPRSFAPEEREFMLALANLSAGLLDRIERQRLYDRTARLQVVTAELTKALSPEDVGQVVIDEVLAVLNADAGRLVIREDGESRTLAVSGYPEEIVGTLPLPGDLALAEDRPVLIESLAEVDEPWAVSLRDAPMHANACAAFPLRIGDRLLGAIGFAWRDEREFGPEDVDFLGALANVCAQSLERAALYAGSERARKELRGLLDAIGEAVLVVDPALHIAYANEEAHLLLGRGLVGRRLPAHWRGLDLRELAESLVAGAAPDTRVTTDDGDVFDLVAFGVGDGTIVILRDVTRRGRQERAEREFVANAAHELRTPLTGIATAADALARGAKDIPAERDYFIGGIVDEVNRLVRLTDALLLLARVQAQPETLHKDRVRLEPVITDVAARLDVRPGVRVRVDVDDHAITGERGLLEGALSNIARNASQHTSQGTIAFESHVEDGTVVLEVTDTGSGMADELRAHATERFVRGDQDDRGFGLGLPMAKEMIRALGGVLEIGRRRRGGTVVRMKLPGA